MPENPKFDPFHEVFLGCVTLKFDILPRKFGSHKQFRIIWWHTKVIGNETSSQRLRQTDRRADSQRPLWIYLPQLKCHTLHTITPNKWPKHRRNLYKTPNGVRAYTVLRRCQTNVVPSYSYTENILFKISNETGYFFAFLMCISFITRAVLILRCFRRFKECCIIRSQERFRIKLHTAALSATLLT